MRLILYLILVSLSAANAAQVKTILAAENPYGLGIGPDGALYICEIDGHQVTRLDLKTHKTTGIGPFQQPYEIVFDAAGNLLVDDMPANIVQRVDRKTGAFTTIAGPQDLKQPHSIAFAPDGGLLICDIGNNRIRRVDPKTGEIATLGELMLGEPMKGPRAVAFDQAGHMYVVLREGNAVYRDGVRFAGTGEKGYAGDGGAAVDAKFNGPKGIACAPDGSVYIADTENHTIRRIDARGVITTVLGTGVRGDGPDGDPLQCRLSRPHGIFVAKDGTVYVGDSESNKVRVVR